jgi:dipeptidyl aminopeptidase/acylaminoacyl peptidase
VFLAHLLQLRPEDVVQTLLGLQSILMIHGDDDRNVPFGESVNVAEILRKQGVHVEQLIFPDEVHSFLLHQNWIKAYEATFEFINRELMSSKK